MKKALFFIISVSLFLMSGCAQLVFVSKRDGHQQIYKMRTSGASQTNISSNSFEDVSPDVSLHGKGIVFASFQKGSAEAIFVMDTNGQNVEQITASDSLRFGPAWGRTNLRDLIAYTRDILLGTKWDSAIWTINENGTNEQKVTNPASSDSSSGEEDDRGLDFWYGGKMIVFSRFDVSTRDSDLYTVYFTGTQDFQRITNTPNIMEGQPVVSHDGKLLAYRASYVSSSFEDTIRIVKVGTWTLVNEIQLQPPASKNIAGIDFSSNDKRLYFAAQSSDVTGNLIDRKMEIFSVKLDGTDQRRLTNNQVYDAYPSIIPCTSWLCNFFGD